MVDLSWNEVRLRYEAMLGANGKFLRHYEDLSTSVPNREYDDLEKTWWGTRRNEDGSPSRGTLQYVPLDDQWTSGYAFVPVDGELIQICHQPREFVRQMPSKGGRAPTNLSDKSSATRSQGKRNFPRPALLFNPHVQANSTMYRKMGMRKENDAGGEERRVSMYTTDCISCEYELDPDTGDSFCIDCGLQDKEIRDVSPVVHIVPSGSSSTGSTSTGSTSTGKGNRLLSPTMIPFPQVNNRLLGQLSECLPGDLRNRISALGSSSSFSQICTWINNRKSVGVLDGQINAWITWNKLDVNQKMLWDDNHFVIAAWIWCSKNDNLLDNELFRNVHICCLNNLKNWGPRDALLIVEILRLMWWEKIGDNLSNWWTPFPANSVP